MDSIAHLTQKLLRERARNNQLPETAPPPYSESDMEDSDDDDDDQDEEEAEPVKLTINSAHRIHGSNNLVPTSSTPLADATKFSTLLLHAINQINAANANARDSRRRPLKVNLTINCGLEIVGDRNVVGAVGVKPKVNVGGNAVPSSVAAVAGAKRKAEDAGEDVAEPEMKKVATGQSMEE
ncbi:hypothetical protein CLAFUW4_01939 [Fulvia fulva]|uniref:Uncharacterized protein n=1 Tax=Passalora fulva TaxID=5499 RepID=A0A9Q8L6V6_PASFU|nr:uncharacterized protein CLAFUR5_01933 [Fulvia fulva]KAK4636078.1 hypothetical protein CLAFUR4_01934 [Fulvia fulva]KAK4636629.1 hypothetical protein CLAFUR0_01936 [Fulvia fulva]UJO11928.1 hypothetical protein CLAFUR5_01933 [Fulvia fulva]WPV09520.1 hypothetical protein CLAFUW4_01939 [Fulvia fulva]WPV23883.1 hypothetical protein CLAFUW7_01938 [Fulvia fulva]